MKKTYTILNEPSSQAYRDLVEHAAARSKFFGVIQRDEESRADASMLAPITQDLEEWSRVSAWPGTILLDGEAICSKYRLSPRSVALLKEVVSSLYSWITPFPEDLHFIRTDGTVFLGTIAHEADAFLELDDIEAADFRRSLPSIEIVADANSRPKP